VLPTGRLVVILCGPPGAGKTTAARQSGLYVYDRDDEQWPSEPAFRTAISALAHQADARACVIRSGATSSARAKAATLTGATHIYLLNAPPTELQHRIAARHRGDTRAVSAGLRDWLADQDHDDHCPPFPGWDHIGPPNLTPGRPITALGRTSREW
jgi:hypothetical protein